ncbi:conserved hypothetical protein [Pseudomonas sp. 9AZ]|uniref:hypothetical protein n=1 Tax=Pseudomonas sp. 9AZ TaxID=2653168 RepID=UPI0012F031DC|nr:hypothetical protein [Pseudomonas sp. 9AZ]VXC76092.1 conserved hypothetical protein [Pseudomonas sp. 9AZ]
MKKATIFIAALLSGCAEMPAYSNIESDFIDESKYVTLETDTYAERKSRSLLSLEANLNIIRINGKKVGDIPFSTYYYRNDSPQKALLKPGKYTIQLEYKLPSHFLFANLEFLGHAGQKILAKSAYIGLNRVDVWLEDAETGKKISSRVK